MAYRIIRRKPRLIGAVCKDESTMNIRGIMGWAGVFAMTFLVAAGAGVAITPVEAVNLALNKPATSSSIENDEHGAAQANDGNADTCWRADDEPESGAEWWQVDLENAADLSGCQITWPYDGMKYRCKVEGSTDRKAWSMLSDRTKSTARTQVWNLTFEKARAIRYVKITVTGFDDGCWASLSEVKVFGSAERHE